jgi:hypothetical protein
VEGSAARAPVYGMAQAGWRWQRSLYPWLIKFGLKQSEADLSIFFMRANADAHRHKDANMTADVLYVGCYVDDLVILYKHDDVAAHSTASSPPHSSNAGASKTRGPSPTSSTSRSSAKATQSHSSRPRISQSCAESTSPGPPAHIHVSAVPHRWTSGSALLKLPQMGDGASPADPALASKYKRLVGALLYCATQTRPDVAYPVSMLCRAMSWPTAALMDAALRVLAYLYKH